MTFLKTISNLKAFFYKFYELEIYPGALSLNPIRTRLFRPQISQGDNHPQ